MADDSYFLPDDRSAESSDSAEELATAQQWASMTFAPVLIDPQNFGPRWDQTRGAIARTAIALLRFDDQGLTQHFLAEAEPLRRALDAHAALEQEIDYLKTHIEALDMAATRLLCVASRCAEKA
jgi:hypothetical protein